MPARNLASTVQVAHPSPFFRKSCGIGEMLYGQAQATKPEEKKEGSEQKAEEPKAEEVKPEEK